MITALVIFLIVCLGLSRSSVSAEAKVNNKHDEPLTVVPSGHGSGCGCASICFMLVALVCALALAGELNVLLWGAK